MKVICTTSNNYIHILPIFIRLWQEFWPTQEVEIVGYDKPSFELPKGFTFYSMGEQQGDAKNFTRDLRIYFKKQDQYFIWIMEDCFLKAPVDLDGIDFLIGLCQHPNVGRINLTDHIKWKGNYVPYIGNVLQNPPDSIVRLSTQPSIWNRDFVLKYMKNDLTPWEFECQADWARDGYKVLGILDAPFKSNEGVRKTDLYKYDFNGIPEHLIKEWL
jgi:hypothetical protein